MSAEKRLGHFLALLTILVWGSTFISSKVLLSAFTPLQIMCMRFVIAYFVLFIIRPKIMPFVLKDELLFLFLGLFGCTLYFLTENYALKYTLASNVSIIVATAPILTSILAHFFTPDEKLYKNVFLGFGVAFSGVILVVFNGAFILKLNPLGDILSLSAAFCWAIYSVTLKRSIAKYESVLLSRKVMFYGFLTAAPLLLLENAPFDFSLFAQNPVFLFNILFLGAIGSGICYVSWNLATKRLGIVTTNSYIYINPFVTLVAAGFFLKEPVSLMGIAGAVLIIFGIVLCGKKPKNNKPEKIIDNLV